MEKPKEVKKRLTVALGELVSAEAISESQARMILANKTGKAIVHKVISSEAKPVRDAAMVNLRPSTSTKF